MGLKVGLLGYGKMGQAIESIALEKGMDIVWRITKANRHELTNARIQEVDVVIEFSRPESAFDNVMQCLESGIPVVCGSTGWQDRLGQAQSFCQQQQGAMIWASNFSIGVNLFFAINQYVAKMMAARAEYSPHVTEIHHIHKLDAPSGTAVTILDQLLASMNQYDGWQLEPAASDAGKISVTAIREGEVPGTHQVRWSSSTDEIIITHKAQSRQGFAMGAVLAAQWIVGKQGVFGMEDVIR